MRLILETERLILREMVESDFPLLCRHLQDAEVMYAWEHAYSDAEVQEGIDKQFQRYKQFGFGIWAVILKENGALIGQCGLSMQPCEDKEVLEIGYINIGTGVMRPKRLSPAVNTPLTNWMQMRFFH